MSAKMKKTVRIGIHASSGSASDKWIQYCQERSIPYKIVNCYDTDIIQQLEDCSALVWHFHHTSIKDKLFAKQLLFAVEHAGKQVFPNFNTSWHFDDKVAQKYALEAVRAPLPPTYVFYQKKKALAWAKTARFPKVFKLRSGAGSSNVHLVRSRAHARSLIHKAFGRGFSPVNRWYRLKESIRKFDGSAAAFMQCLIGGFRTIVPMRYARLQKRERGYVYFQDFIPGNDSDLRVIVIGDKAFAAKRMARKNDFRASGSGIFNFNPDVINKEAIRIAFETVRNLNAQCLAFDFVFDPQKQPLIVEISYAFCSIYDNCSGYWDAELNWVNQHFSPQELMIESVLNREPLAPVNTQVMYL